MTEQEKGIINTIEELFIRACKSENPHKRIRSVYRRYYLKTNKNVDQHLANILSRIIEKYDLITQTRLINDLNPANHWRFGLTKEDSYNKCVLHVATSVIRFSKKDKFPGLGNPANIRKMNREDKAA